MTSFADEGSSGGTVISLTTPNLHFAEEPASVGFRARDYLCDFALACDRALGSARTEVHDVHLGGALVRLRFAGPALVQFVLPALEHLRTEATSGQPLLTVDLWDAESTGVFPPSFPTPGEDAPALGEIREYGDTGVRAVFHSGVRPQDGAFKSVTFFDERASVARYFVVRPSHVRWHERAAPLRSVLHWALNGPNRLLVHAGAVGIGGRCVLLTGPGGSGKSTSAVAALLGGLDYLGDDYVLVDLTDQQPVAHSLYATAKLAPGAMAVLPSLRNSSRRPGAPDDEKLVFDVEGLRPGGLGTSARIVGIVLPRLHPDGPTRLRCVSAVTALQALAPSTIFQAPERNGAELGPLAHLARSVPAFVLELGGPPEEVGPVLARLLNGEGPTQAVPTVTLGPSI
jgi:hypothetical protein